MVLRKIVFFIPAFLLFFSTTAQNNALELINISELKKHLNIIASDSLMGRQIGAENNGLNMAADYIKTTAENIGLSSVNDSYYQQFSLHSSKPDPGYTFLQAFNKNNKLLFTTDSVISLSGDNEINIEYAEIVFAGYGIDPKMFRNSGNSDISGKIVMLMVGDEKSNKKRKTIWDEQSENDKINVAIENGALGVILVNSTFDKKNDIFLHVKQRMARSRFSLEKPEENSNGNNSILIPASVADAILGGEGKLQARLKKMNKRGKINFHTNIKASIQCKRLNKEIETKNIIGIVEGSDPVLKNECVVLMAHYDHLGIDSKGDVYNGADDNGSGVVALLEVAEAMVKTPRKPKRSVLFLWVSSEEIGLFGSQYYAINPVFPLKKTVTCINIDMAGRVYEPRDSIWKDSPKKVKDFDGLYTLTNNIWPGLKKINTEKCMELRLAPDYSLPSNFLRSSDHFHFHDNGVPILNMATGYHYDYHKVSDEVSRINFDKMKRVADLCYLVSYEVANLDVIEFQK
ncbi:MAG: M20/M25/M40 family metallo-hydrolase [Prolixibacteraceae bacterium]|nr:M20/M25/M40 family metallo-hydrolase [Prolixibacteraceae bacterium]